MLTFCVFQLSSFYEYIHPPFCFNIWILFWVICPAFHQISSNFPPWHPLGQGTKLVAAHFGGTRTPMVMSWPKVGLWIDSGFPEMFGSSSRSYKLGIGLMITGWWFGTFFFIHWECHHPNWLILFRGVAQPPTRFLLDSWKDHSICRFSRVTNFQIHPPSESDHFPRVPQVNSSEFPVAISWAGHQTRPDATVAVPPRHWCGAHGLWGHWDQVPTARGGGAADALGWGVHGVTWRKLKHDETCGYIDIYI